MPIEGMEELKETLRETGEVHYTYHFEREKLPERDNVSKKLIEQHLNDPSELFHFEYQEDDEKGEKYDLYFDKSSKYVLRILVSIIEQEYLNVVTAHVINKQRSEKAQKYL